MSRASDDSWEVTQGVGATALGVAWARANETVRADALFRDPCAELFLDAAQRRGWPLPTGAMAERIRSIGDYAASRTAWFDDFFNAAASAGVCQAVLVGAGLDARAYRLNWADGTVVYEIDQPRVLQFKAQTLGDAGVRSTADTCVAVPVDLRADWPSALQAAGFDRSAPAAWSVEGLLPYLPAPGQDLLFERIDALSADDSRIAVESFGAEFFDSEHLELRRRQMQKLREEGTDDGGTDIEDLWYIEERTDVADWLTEHGWDVASIDWRELLNRYRPGTVQNSPRTVYVAGRKGN